MAPIDNVWMSGRQLGLVKAFDAVSGYLRKNAKNYDKRALVLPHKSALREDYLQAYIANGNVGSPRGRSGERGGPVLAIDPTLKVLEMGIRLADGQVFGVATVHPGDVSGWVAATRALDLETGERHPGVPPDIEEALRDLYDAGYNGYGRAREDFFAAKYFPPIDILMAAGYHADFVAGYLITLGKSADSVEHLKKIYVEPTKRPRIPRGR